MRVVTHGGLFLRRPCEVVLLSLSAFFAGGCDFATEPWNGRIPKRGDNVQGARESASTERVLRTVLVTDIVGSTEKVADMCEAWRYVTIDHLSDRSATYGLVRRERLLTHDEVRRIFAALTKAAATGSETPSTVLAIRLLFATAGRASEVLSLRWNYFRHETNEIVWPEIPLG